MCNHTYPQYQRNHPNPSMKSITNTSKSVSSNVYSELFKLHPYDAQIVGVIVPTQNVKNVK